MTRLLTALCVVLVACGPLREEKDAGHQGADAGPTTDAGQVSDAGSGWTDSCGFHRPNVFINSVVSFTPGPSSGYGQENMPCVVEGPPQGLGPYEGSLNVVSFGDAGTITVSFDDVEIVDGPGVDLIVFENPFPGWLEPGFVGVSDDGINWTEWPCEPENADAGYPFCAGIHPVLSNPDNDISPTDVAHAGGDDFDLAVIGVKQAHFVRVRDSGFSHYGNNEGGFDLDAMAAINSVPRTDGGMPGG